MSKYGATPGVPVSTSTRRRAASRPAAGRTAAPARCRRAPASSGSSVSSSRRSPRSLPYDVEFSLTSTSSRTPCSASQRASARTSDGRRETKAPRKLGIAQNVQRRSQPRASFSGATGLSSSRRRTTVGPPAWPGRPMSIAPGSTTLARSTGLIGSSLRRSPGCGSPGRSPSSTAAGGVGQAGVGVEAEHGVGLGQLLGELLAVPLGQAADGDDLGAGVGRGEQRVDRVLLGALDEAAGVHDDDVGASSSSTSSQPAASSRPASSSESTSLRAQPSVTRATRRSAGGGTRKVYGRASPCGVHVSVTATPSPPTAPGASAQVARRAAALPTRTLTRTGSAKVRVQPCSTVPSNSR